MKVAIVSRIFSPEPSAASFILEAVAREFSSRGSGVEVLTSSLPDGASEVEMAGVRISRAPVLRDKTGYLRGYIPYMSFDIPLFFRIVFGRRSDLYFVEPPPTTGAVVRIATWIIRRPYFYDAADIWSDAAMMTTSNRAVLWLLRRTELFSLSGAKKIFTISLGVRDRLQELGVTAPIEVAGFGVDTAIFEITEPASPDLPYFIYAGTFSEPHGAEVVIRGFASFMSEFPSHRLLFVGNGTELTYLKTLATELGVEVEFRTTVQPSELNDLLNSAVASLATLRPGVGYDYAFTTKVYASLAAGCPVIFSGVGPTIPFLQSIPSSLRWGKAMGFDAEKVAEALASTASNPLSRDERQALSSWSQQQFSISSIARRVVDGIFAEAHNE